MKYGKKIFAFLVVILMAAGASATITSVDRLTFDSNADFFDGEAFVFEITGNRDTDTIDILLDNELDSQVEGDVQNSVSIEATQTKSKLKYGFRDTGDVPIYKFGPRKLQVDVGALDSESTIERKIRESGKLSNCYDISGDGAVSLNDDYVYKVGWDGFNAVSYVYCVDTEDRVGNVGEIDSGPSTIWETQFRVEDASGVYEKTVTNGGGGSGSTVRFGEHVIIQSSGAYEAGNKAPSPTDEKILHSNTNYFIDPYTGEKIVLEEGGFTVIDAEDYDSYRDSVPSLINNLESWRDGAYNDIDKSEVVDSTNNLASTAAEPFADSEFAGGEYSGTDFNGGTMTLDVPNLVFPQYTGYARVCRTTSGGCDAAAIIEKTVGKPKITSTSGTTVSELNTGYVSAEVKNVGDAEGQFTASIRSCSTGFSSLGSSRTFSLNSGQTSEVQFPVSFSSTSSDQKKQTGSCTFRVEESNLGTTVTESISVTGKQKNECTPGETFRKVVDGKYAVFQCTDNGLDQRKILQCNNGEIASKVEGEYRCLDESEVDDPVVDKKGECEKEVFGTSFTDPVCAAQSSLNSLTLGISTAVTLLEWASGLAAFIYGLGLGQTYLAPITRRFSEAANLPVSGGQVTGVTGLISGLFLGLIVLSLASSLVVKIAVFFALAAAIYINIGIESATPW